MKKFFILICCLLISVSVHADYYKRIYRNNDPDKWKSLYTYWVIFVARETGKKYPGHAFIVWGKRHMRKKQWVSLEGYGLYPKKSASIYEIISGNVPGSITKEAVVKVKNDNYDGLAVNVTKQMYDYSMMNTKALKQGKFTYNLYNQNCIYFTEIVVNALGLNLPKGSYSLPAPFMKALKESN